MRKYIVTKQEPWEDDCEIIGIFDTFEKLSQLQPFGKMMTTTLSTKK